jgi:thioredoxin reductase
MFDVIIIGGGTAGLSAALVLGRALRSTLVVQAGPPRNAPSPEAHSLFTRDGTPPAQLLELGRAQLAPYETVAIRGTHARAVTGAAGGFTVAVDDGAELPARRVLLAVGVRDELPPIDGMAELWGRGVLHCPYCHGWEVRGGPLAVHARGAGAMEFVPLLLQWSRDLLLCTDGDPGLSPDDLAALARHGVRVVQTPLARVEGDAHLERIVFADGRVEPRRALFIRPPQRVGSDIPAQLGCDMTEAGHISVGPDQQTSVRGVYAAGDATTPMQQLVAAAASGAAAAGMINRDLIQEEFAGTFGS